MSNTATVLGPFSAPSEFTWSPIEAPADLKVTYDMSTGTLSGSWSTVSGADGYSVEVLDAAGVSVFATTGPEPAFSDPGANLATGQAYTVTVQATLGSPPHTFGLPTSASFTVVGLTAPTITTVTSEPSAIEVDFSLVEGASSYTALVLDAAGSPLNPSVSATADAPPLTIDGTSLVASTLYQVEVQALSVTTTG